MSRFPESFLLGAATAAHQVEGNNINSDFWAQEQMQHITYIRTGQGWLYLAIIKNLCTCKVVGHALSTGINTRLVLDALAMALRRQRPAPGLIFHSDRGVQYASARFRAALAATGIRQSMSRKGDPYDNAVAENFFCCLKCEALRLTCFLTHDRAADAVFAYIKAFYNTVRPHSDTISQLKHINNPNATGNGTDRRR